jgi:hypothetical protein
VYKIFLHKMILCSPFLLISVLIYMNIYYKYIPSDGINV